MKKILSLAFILTAPFVMAEWEFDTRKDEITDEVTILMGTNGKLKRQEFGIQTPVLFLMCKAPRIKDGKPTGRILVALSGKSFDTKFMENTTKIIYRLDSRPPVETTCPVGDMSVALFRDPVELISGMKTARKMVVRYEHMLAGTLTATFDLSDFTENFAKFRDMVKKNATPEEPPTVEPDSPSSQSAPAATQTQKAPDEKLVAKATASLNDILLALEYAKTRTGFMPRMKSETVLIKPLEKLKSAIAKKEQATEKFVSIERRFNNLKPGRISRPSQEQLDRAKATLKSAEKEQTAAVVEVCNEIRRILQETDWPTPELLEDAQRAAVQAENLIMPRHHY